MKAVVLVKQCASKHVEKRRPIRTEEVVGPNMPICISTAGYFYYNAYYEYVWFITSVGNCVYIIAQDEIYGKGHALNSHIAYFCYILICIL